VPDSLEKRISSSSRLLRIITGSICQLCNASQFITGHRVNLMRTHDRKSIRETEATTKITPDKNPKERSKRWHEYPLESERVITTSRDEPKK